MFDIVIRNGQVVDGLGGPRRRADVGIAGDRIVAVGDLAGQEAGRAIDATGLIVAPGFVDIHSHSDWTLLASGRAESSVRQGVTTEVVGNCGFSWASTDNPDLMKESIPAYVRDYVDVDWTTFDGYLKKLERQGVAINVAPLVGHGAIRTAALGFDARPPSTAELARMKAILSEDLDAGAVGLSFGLAYAPGSIATRDEIVALCQIAAGRGKPFTVHMRDYGPKLLEATREVLTVARETGARLQISHVPPYEGGAPAGAWDETIALIERARADGVDVAFDLHPYLWGMTLLNVVLPTWAFEGGVKKILERLQDPAARARIKESDKPHVFAQMLQQGHWDKLMLAYTRNSSHLVGKTFDRIADELKKDAYDAALDLLLAEGDALYGAWWLGKIYDEGVQTQVLQHPLAMVEADGMALAVDGPLAGLGLHPRCFGWTARMLGRHVRDRQIMTLEEAVHKMTASSADRVGLVDRGRLVEGARADVVVFDFAGINDNATYAKPAAYPSGFHHVLVNGQLVVTQGSHTGALPGTVIRKS